MTQLLKDILQDSKRLRSLNAVLLWAGVVEQGIARHTEAIKLQRGILYVATKSPAWSQELNFLKVDLIEKLNRCAGYRAVRDIRFKYGQS
ncbi:DUF721 domain-containing protein [Candidatus Saganbacteria bacterium]|nr:DUF721 domain-containing protein [Candidatus Saganbacteria bacterium]